MTHLTECPRDAMQGIEQWIATEDKIRYINSLLSVGFDVIDFGSFVSEKAIPQLRDTRAVLDGLEPGHTKSKLLAIVANRRGAEEACEHERIQLLGFPFSISETFQMRNTNSTIEQSLARVEEIQSLCIAHNKSLVVYISMGFGNPYGEPWHPSIATEWCRKLYEKLGIRHMALSDTIGVANAGSISELFSTLIPALANVEFGAHLHTTPQSWSEKIEAAWQSGCRKFDGAIRGFGGCPMAADKLTGNMPTENIIQFLDDMNERTALDRVALARAMQIAAEIFPPH